jgi:hypothetical protein
MKSESCALPTWICRKNPSTAERLDHEFEQALQKAQTVYDDALGSWKKV